MTSTAMSSFRRRRPLIALLCAQMLISACSASGSPAATTEARWPEPAPLPRVAPGQGGGVIARSEPHFQAPSATSCARPIVTHEIPGLEPRQRSAGLDRRSTAKAGVASRSDTRDEAAIPAPAVAVAPNARAGRAFAESTAKAAEMEAPRFAPAAPLPSPVAPSVQAPPRQSPPAQQRVTAGMVDDNADFAEYLRFRERTQVSHRERDVAERYLLQVRDARGAVVPDAEVAVRAAGGAAMWARTDAGGRAWLHPDAFDPARSQVYEVAVRKDGRQSVAFLRRGQKSAVDVVLDRQTAAARARLDLVFLIDATGSMGDEIGKLKATLRSIADDVARLPSRPDTCFGLVAYRDRSDAFMVRTHDFTNDLGAFQGVLDKLQAAGGGDYPEAMNEALHETVHRLSWRGAGATRMVVLLADAPPHLDYGGPQYDDDMMAALGKGIKVFSVGASGLSPQGEYIQRQIAQYTGGRFVFLTYKEAGHAASGPGRETVHDVSNYSVQTLDRLIVRLVSEELQKLPAGS